MAQVINNLADFATATNLTPLWVINGTAQDHGFGNPDYYAAKGQYAAWASDADINGDYGNLDWAPIMAQETYTVGQEVYTAEELLEVASAINETLEGLMNDHSFYASNLPFGLKLTRANYEEMVHIYPVTDDNILALLAEQAD